VSLLLDTNVLIWALEAPDRLGSSVRAELEAPDADVAFSAASIWEIAIKTSLGNAAFHVDPFEVRDSALRTGFSELVITSHHGAVAGALPTIHRDPFDRMLVAQAIIAGRTLLTSDHLLSRYPCNTRVLG